jgi:hypothetical protein
MLHVIFLVADDQFPLSDIWYLMVVAFIPKTRYSPISRNTDTRSKHSTPFNDRIGGGIIDVIYRLIMGSFAFKNDSHGSLHYWSRTELALISSFMLSV